MKRKADHALVRPLALRAYMRRAEEPKPRQHTSDTLGFPTHALIFDTETTIDWTQTLLFGSYRYCREMDGQYVAVEEGLIYADELPKTDPRGFARLQALAARERKLRLHSRSEFIHKVFFPAACRAEAIIVGFNLPFDLSRLAVECGEGRRGYYGGFSFALADYPVGKRGKRCEDTYCARVAVKSIDSKRAFMGFTGGREPHKGYGMRGRFLDLKTLAFALTSVPHSLQSACKAFAVRHGKGVAKEHGRITDEYIAYNRRDVLASMELLNALRREFECHPISLDPCKAYSPASIAKAYLDALGIARPIQQFKLPAKVHGIAMSCYYGGRAEIRIRNSKVPVVYTDFLSMYPTVNTLMGLWTLLTAESIEVVDCTAEVREMLAQFTTEQCFNPNLWRELSFFAQMRPNGDIVPARTRYSNETDAWNIGVNPVMSKKPMWYAGPDIVGSTLLAKKAPEIIRAFRIVPRGQCADLQSLKLAGRIPVDPRTQDFFRLAIEERKSVRRRKGISSGDATRLEQFLKILVNAGSYGVFAEMNANERPVKAKKIAMKLFGIDAPSEFSAREPEEIGKYCFPPIAALIPAAARLMLALLERTVTDMGGFYGLCDTDSMAIVATKNGGVIECPGGPLRTKAGKPAIRALSWADVDAIAERFRALSPYNPEIVSGSILKIEDENYRGKHQRQLYMYAISAKRYALFTVSARGAIHIVKKSDHGLGHLLNPIDPDSENTDWIAETWEYLISSALGIPMREPSWLDRPAISRLTISSPHVYRPFAEDRSRYAARVKPFNFALSAHVAPFGHPEGVDATKFHLVAPYERDPRKWLRTKWVDIHSGESYAISTSKHAGTTTVRVKSFRDVLEGFATHPEPKSAAPDGGPCARSTRGLLRRRPVTATGVFYVGKESKRVDEVEHGLVHDWDDVQTVIAGAPISLRSVRARMHKVKVEELAESSGLGVRQLQRIRNGHTKPRGAVLARIDAALRSRAMAASVREPEARSLAKETGLSIRAKRRRSQ